MKSDEIITAVEHEAAKVETAAKGWLKSIWARLKALSFKTKATITVSVIILSGMICGMISASHAPTYVSRSDANRMLAEHDSVLRSEIKTLSQHADTLDAGLHQLDSRLKAVEAKPEPAKITTGSIPKKAHVKKPARKPASSWFDLP